MHATTRLLAGAVFTLSVAAHADYVCRALDVPGSKETQVWEINNSGQAAASSDVGGSIYSGGAWLPLPPPPASSGYTVIDVGALGINDSGVIAGIAEDPAGVLEQGFILTGDTYFFFSHNPASFRHTEPRAISNSGIVTGCNFDDEGFGPAWVYNPAGAPGYPAGFTDILPSLEGAPSIRVIPGAMNGVGQFVGSADFADTSRQAFVYDPSNASPFSFFQVGGRDTAARGINDNGAVTGFTNDPVTGNNIGFLLTSAGVQTFTCPELEPTLLAPESINNSNLISGNYIGSAGTLRGFIAYPNVVLPVTSSGGSFVFDAAVAPNTPVFLDPVAAVGYRYAIGSTNPRFATVTLPIGIGGNIYTVLAEGDAFTLAAGERLDFTRNGFPAGVPSFEVLDIAPSAGLDPANPTAFVTEVTFASGGRFTGTMQPLTPGDELDDLVRAAASTRKGGDLAELAHRARRAYRAGKTPAACAALQAFVCAARDQSRDDMSQFHGRTLAAEAQAVENAVGCASPPPACSSEADR